MSVPGMLTRDQMKEALKKGAVLHAGRLITSEAELPSEAQMAAGNQDATNALIAQKRALIAQTEEEIRQLEEGPKQVESPMTQEELRAWRAERAGKSGAPAEGEEEGGAARGRHRSGPRQRKAEEGAAEE